MSRYRLPKQRPPTHPGDVLLHEFLEPWEMSQADFAERIGVSYVRLNSIINGRRGVTPDTALRLERATGLDADVWLDLQTRWDLWHAMQSEAAREIELIELVTR